MNSDLKKRVISGGIWTVGAQMGSHVLRLVSNLILTRLLVPEFFGVMAIIQIINSSLEMMSDVGLRVNVMRSEHGDKEDYLNTIWVLMILRGLLLWMIAIGLTFALMFAVDNGVFDQSSTYAYPLLPLVIFVTSFYAVLKGFESTKIASANRKIDLKPIMFVELGSQFIALVYMVILAWFYPSIWVLASGVIVAQVLKTFFSHYSLSGIVNKIQFNKGYLSEIFGFGKWIVISSMFTILAIHGDKILLGGHVDPATMGVYFIAFLLVHSIKLVLNRVIYTVVFPATSETYRNNPERLGFVYYKFRKLIDVTALLLCSFLFVAGQSIIDILYNDNYAYAGVLFQLLALLLFFDRFETAVGTLNSIGNSLVAALSNGLKVLVIFSLLGLGYDQYGMKGVVYVLILASLLQAPLIFYFKVKYKIFNFFNEVKYLPLLGVGYVAGLGFNYVVTALK